MTAALDIIIVNFNTVVDLRRCLASLAAVPPQRPHQVTVVDNASSDGSTQMVQAEFSDVTVIGLDRNVGFAAANNIGIRRTSAPLILLLNSDTVVPRGALDALAARLEATGVTAVGPRLVDGEGRAEISWGPMLNPLAEAWQAWRVRQASSDAPSASARVTQWTSVERDVDWVTGACLLVRREAAEAVGLLDERYFMYEEDVDFCAAIRAAGGRVRFVPSVEVVHLRGRSFSGRPGAASALYDASHLAFYEKHAPHWAPLLRLWLSIRGRRLPPTG